MSDSRKSGSTYEAKAEYRECAQGMSPDAQPEDGEMPGAHNEVPEKVASCERLDEARRASVAVYALDGAMPHIIPFLVGEHDPKGEGVDQA